MWLASRCGCEGGLPVWGKLTSPPSSPAPKQVKQTTEEEDKQPHVLLLALVRSGMGRSAQLMLPDVEPEHRQLLTVYQPGLNSSSTRARHVHWEMMKEWDSWALVKWVSAQEGSYSRRTCACGERIGEGDRRPCLKLEETAK